MRRTLIIVQARMESQRYPGKILAPFCGQPMLLFQLARLATLHRPYSGQQIVVASPYTVPNIDMGQMITRHGFGISMPDCDPNDVLSRYYLAAKHYDASTIVRLTGDTPMIHASHVEAMLDAWFLRREHARYREQPILDHLGIAPEWGDGFDCEVFSFSALETAYSEATLPSEREHVTPYLYNHPERFTLGTYPCPLDLSWMRCSVDTPEDLMVVHDIATTCMVRYGFDFSWRDVWSVVQGSKFEAWMRGKAHNPAYVAQVAAERGVDADTLTWQEMRYNLHTGKEF